MCGIYGFLQLDGAPALGARLDGDGGQDGPPRPRRRGPPRRRPGRARHAAPVDHRPRRRPPAADQRGRHAVAGRQRRDLQLPRAARRARRRRATASAPAPTARCCCTSTSATATPSWRRLNGMFGFALWDARRRRLLVGRDRLGIKPLYVARTARGSRSPARPRRCSRCPAARRRSIPTALRAYLGLGYVPGPQSIFAGIRKLPPATLLVAEGGRVEERRYWRCRPTSTRAQRGRLDRARARAARAVGAMQMVSDVPIGAFLSGGVDSSAVVAFMARHTDASGQDLRDRLRRRRRRGLLQRAALRARGGAALRHRASRDRRQARRRVAAAQACLAHGRADRRLGLHHDLPRLRVRASRRHGDPLGRRRRRALRRLPALPRQPLPGAPGPPAAPAAARGGGAGGPPAGRPALAAAQRDAPRARLPRDRRAAVRGALPLLPRRLSRARRSRSCCARRRADDRDALGEAFAGGDVGRRAQPHARGRRRDAAARRPAAADRQDEHGRLARVPRAAARPRAGRARRADAGRASRCRAGG